MECLFTKDMVVRKTIMGNQESASFITFKSTPFMHFGVLSYRISAFPEFYLALIRSMGAGKTATFSVFDPLLLDIFSLRLEKKGNHAIDYLGDKVSASLYRLTDGGGEALLDIWVGDHNEGIIRMAEPEGLLAFERTDSSVVHRLERVDGVDISAGRTCPSEVYFPAPLSLTSAKLMAALKVRGASFLNHKIAGYESTFQGKKDGPDVEGIFEIKTSNPMIAQSAPFGTPVADETLRQYLDPERGVELNDTGLKNKAVEVTWKSASFLDASRRVNEWIFKSVAQGYGLPSARYTLETMQGGSFEKSLLAVALLRSAGIPARSVGGIFFDKGNFGPHTWVEAYVGKDGWIPMDPSTGEFGKVSALHIFLLEKGELLAINVKVIDFGPLPSSSVPHQRRELRWPVGETRTYAIRKDGSLIGAEKAGIREMTMVDGVEAFHLVAESTFKTSRGEIAMKADLFTTLEGLPLEYRVDQEIEGRIERRAYAFRKGMITCTEETADGKAEHKVPFSTGTYLFDRNLFSLLALVIGQMPEPKAGVRASYTVFIPQDMASKEISVEVKGDEVIKIGESDYRTWRCEIPAASTKCNITSAGDVMRLNIPQDGLEVEMVEKKFQAPGASEK
jgi:hypothetical protein